MEEKLCMERADWVTLLSNVALAWSLCMEIVVRAIDAPDEEPARILRSADEIVDRPPTIIILGDPALWERFKVLRRFGTILLAELNRRLQRIRKASEIAQLMLPRMR
jgi:hypothetical protein